MLSMLAPSPEEAPPTQLQPQPSTSHPATTSPEETPVPPPSTFRSLLNAQPFVPGTPRVSTRTRRLDQVPQSLRGGAAPDTSPPPTPPSSPQRTPPPATVSERQHCSPGVDVAASQPLPSSPTVVESVHPTPPSSPGPLPPPARVPGPLTRISIDPENMNETLRQPMYQELTPFAGRRLGDFEWVAFEEVLNRWSTAIKEVVTAQRRRPPNPTSQWARRRRRREQEARSPSPAAELPADPSQTTEEQG